MIQTNLIQKRSHQRKTKVTIEPKTFDNYI